MTTKLQQFCIDILPVVQAGAKGSRIERLHAGEFFQMQKEPHAFYSDTKYQVMHDMVEVSGFMFPPEVFKNES